MKKLLFFALIAAAATFSGNARDARAEVKAHPELAGGVYFAYPADSIATGLSTPKGYEPFYVSHYGRHGSRYLIWDDDYKKLKDIFDKAYDADALTERGRLLKHQLDTIWTEAQGRAGELSPLGARQHHGIGHRMAQNYPAVFADGADVTATSTTVMRCAHSMFNFLDGVREEFPGLQVPMESGKRHMKYMSFQTPESSALNKPEGPYYQDYKRFKDSKMQSDRLVKSLFKDQDYVNVWLDQYGLMEKLYWLAVGQQNIENGIDLLPLFTNDELYGLWEFANFSFFARASTYPRANGTHVKNARNLLGNILEGADSYIASGKHGATLRFGHDSNIIPLLGLLRVEGCYSDTDVPSELSRDYADYYVSPMATNLQLIFFRPSKGRKGDTLVRVLHNERPAGLPVANAGEKGLYRWADLRPYIAGLLTD
ncbi:MAG: histidine phosphatase family protein [Muribaculaceae bacterium]|nr:histidine phosphatase family protein [Muribaculaceae bacterium]